MHELGIALEILALVQRHVPNADAARVREVHVRVGALAGVVPESLDFCFGAAVAGTPWQQATLVIERVPAQARCEACGQMFATETPGAGCPACGDRRVRMVTGRELNVATVDLADEMETGDRPEAADAAAAVGANGEEAVA